MLNLSDAGLLRGDGLALNLCPPGAGCSSQSDQSALTPVVQIPPLYPRQAAQAGLSGFVTLAFTVSPDGYVSDVVVIDADPPRIFDRAATKALLRWRFRPKQVDGVAVAARATQTMAFSLAD